MARASMARAKRGAIMKLCTFMADGAERLGAVTPHGILDLEACARRADDPPAVRQALVSHHLGGMVAFLEGGETSWAAAAALIPRAVDYPDSLRAPDRVRLRPPVPGARKLFCLAGNYQEHIREGGAPTYRKAETYPYFFMKPPSTVLIGSGEAIRLPRTGQAIDWEGELAVVIGKLGRHIRAAEAERYIAGYSCFNDVSERRLAVPAGRTPREKDRFFDWLVGKWFDTAGPMGPYLVTRDEVPDPHALSLRVRVSGEVKQDANTGQMIFTVPELIEFISRVVTLEPGDIIATGTPAGTGSAQNQFLRPGDVVEVEIGNLGVLTNPVAAEG
jgi:2-keto-4-pentenoate hydratase/2-oxohepta-3-ene-1,7-dioic acid hydratase in catechol pathway